MGYDAEAALSYGIDLEDREFPWSDSDDFNTWWVEQSGLKEPEIKESEDYDSKAYMEFRKARTEIMNKCPVELVMYGADSHPQYILVVRESTTSGDWSWSTEVEESAFTISAERIAAFRAFCERYQIDCQRLRWLLTAYYG